MSFMVIWFISPLCIKTIFSSLLSKLFSLCPNCSQYIQWCILSLVFMLHFWLSKKQRESSKISSFIPGSHCSRAHIRGMEMLWSVLFKFLWWKFSRWVESGGYSIMSFLELSSNYNILLMEQISFPSFFTIF